MANTKSKTKKNAREIEFSNFFFSIRSTKDTIAPIILDLQKKAKSKHDKFYNYINDHGEKINKTSIRLKQPFSSKADILRNEYLQYRHATVVVPSSLFISIISKYESLISNFIKSILIEDSNLLKTSQKNIAYDQILSFSSVHKLKSYILDKEIFSFTSMGPYKQLEWIEKKFNVEIIKKISDVNLFVECCMRRNIYVHSDGKCSKDYLKFCKENKIIFDRNPKENEKITLNPKYFFKAYGILLEVATIVSQELWRKLKPNEIELADDILNDGICYKLLKSEDYSLAEIILEYPTKHIKKYSSDQSKYALIINKAIAHKFSGKNDEMNKLLDKYDWSALKHIYEMAYHVLKDEDAKAVMFMRLIGNDEIQKIFYSQWPLFKEFKKKKIFKEAYKDIYNEEFSEVFK